MNNQMTNYRSDVIDSMKGLGIILVVLGHTVCNSLSEWIYSFHMPHFFVISGLFLKEGNNVYLKRAKTILVPYLVFAIVTYIYWRFLEQKFRPLNDSLDVNKHFFDIFWQMNEFKFDVVLWFLPCLFFTITFLIFLLKIIKHRYIIICVCVLWVIVVSMYIPDT